MVVIPITERHGLMAAIGLWVFEEACRQAAQWREAGLRMRIAVNISGHQLRREARVDPIEASLRRHRIPPGRLTCEITETVAIEDTEVTRQALERFRQAGLHVSIDDFGTGHMSLTGLRHLPAAALQIDRAFVGDLASGDGARDRDSDGMHAATPFRRFAVSTHGWGAAGALTSRPSRRQHPRSDFFPLWVDFSLGGAVSV